MPGRPTLVDSQPFRAASVTSSMAHSTTLVSVASGGVLQRSIQATPGTETWSIAMTALTGTTAISVLGFLSVFSGIRISFKIDNLPHLVWAEFVKCAKLEL